MERSEVAIIIPAFNEAATIASVVESVMKYGQPFVVDDCSKDETAKLAEAAGAIVISHEINQGYDGALNSGFAEANRRGYSYAITFDADAQHDPTLLEKFLFYLKKSDLVLGVRPNHARLAEQIFAFYARIRFGIKDPLCGMKGYRMNLYQERGWFDSYQSIGTELTLYGAISKKLFVQVPIPIAERNGVPRFGQRWKANFKILRAMILSLKLN